VFGSALTSRGNGLVFYAYKNPSDAVLVMSQILGSAGMSLLSPHPADVRRLSNMQVVGSR
jgi:hypothetical protein